MHGDDSTTSVRSAPRHPRHRMRRILVAGLLILTPVALTVWFLVQLFQLMDGMFAPILTKAIGFRIPGLGLLLTLMVILLLGWLSTNVVGRRIIRAMEELLLQIPVARSVFMATKGVVEAVSRSQTEAFKRVVMVEYPSKGLFALAFVTGTQDWRGAHDALHDFTIVFLPTSPNPTSGYLLLVPRERVIPLPITVEEGIRMVISGGILLPSLPPFAPPSADGVPAEGATSPAPIPVGASPGAGAVGPPDAPV